jgi:hypothetical protein
MATTDQFDIIRPTDMIPTTGTIGNLQPIPTTDGLSAGVPLRAKLDSGYTFISRVPATGTPLSTGLTFGLALVDDPASPGAGKVVRVGISVKLLATGTDNLTATGMSAETVTSVTMDATTGEYVLSSIAIANASIDTLAASALYLVRIRRVGTDALDTHPGTVLLLGVTVRDT